MVMQKKTMAAMVFLACSALTSLAAADIPSPSGPSCRCEVPGSTASGPLEMGVSALVFGTGVVIAMRRRRQR